MEWGLNTALGWCFSYLLVSDILFSLYVPLTYRRSCDCPVEHPALFRAHRVTVENFLPMSTLGKRLSGGFGSIFLVCLLSRVLSHRGWLCCGSAESAGCGLGQGDERFPSRRCDAVPGLLGNAKEVQVPWLGSKELIVQLKGRKLHETNRWTQAAGCWEVQPHLAQTPALTVNSCLITHTLLHSSEPNSSSSK